MNGVFFYMSIIKILVNKYKKELDFYLWIYVYTFLNCVFFQKCVWEYNKFVKDKIKKKEVWIC